MSAESETRNAMSSFWQEHSKTATVEEMMLDDNAKQISDDESREILSMIPKNLKEKSIIELGAGIGRFTGHLASQAKHVTANDFMESFMEKNRALHGHLSNIDFICEDVTKLDLPEESADIVFSNWLFMYLSDEETTKVFYKILDWLKMDGLLFFRESCYHPSGNKSRTTNPTVYRNPIGYNRLIESVFRKSEPDATECVCFEVVFTRSVQTYVKVKDNPNQLCWMVRKTTRNTVLKKGYKTEQELLDHFLYKQVEIAVTEKYIQPEQYMGLGGLTMSQECMNILKIAEDHFVLDVGCGAGGQTFYIAEKHGARVLGVDLSCNMIMFALERLQRKKEKRPDHYPPLQVSFEVADVNVMKFSPGCFDAILCRDVLYHIENKKQVLSKLGEWLRPGGRLLLTSFTKTNQSDWLETYQHEFCYFFDTAEYLEQTMKDVGFSNVFVQNKTAELADILQNEIDVLNSREKEIVQEFSTSDFNEQLDRRRTRLDLCREQSMGWFLFYGEKGPLTC